MGRLRRKDDLSRRLELISEMFPLKVEANVIPNAVTGLATFERFQLTMTRVHLKNSDSCVLSCVPDETDTAMNANDAVPAIP